MMRRFLIIPLVWIILLGCQQNPADSLRNAFLNPPGKAKPWVFWYWMRAAVSKKGITADLEAMKEAGIGGAYLMPIKGADNPPLIPNPKVQLTPEWWELVRHAFSEADRLNLKLAMHASDGFALAGGPWITPELSMQKVVWADTLVSGE
ncbi:MAG TPA: glycosyl hydrolase, partial [Prolixibacteraceae bacterium]|nr:glycosyl hydrolase [Prolixibacteraceae bacterium]